MYLGLNGAIPNYNCGCTIFLLPKSIIFQASPQANLLHRLTHLEISSNVGFRQSTVCLAHDTH